jgi:glycosyltransferase involved in cell wall biosynthesis
MIGSAVQAPGRSRRVLVIAYDGKVNPSTRLRILQYIPSLQRRGFELETHFVLDGGRDAKLERAEELLQTTDIVFVQRVLSRELVKLLRRAGRPVVFDLDDAVHYIRQSQYSTALRPRSPRDVLRVAYRSAARGSRFYSSRKRLLDAMIELAAVVVLGNEWLARELAVGDDRGIVVPTSVWVTSLPCKTHSRHSPTSVGWIGVRSNLYHLDGLARPFRALRARFGSEIALTVVSNTPYDSPLPTRFVPWSLESENDAVLGFDVGLMPLQNDPFSRGKCAFKAVLCMAHGVPVVASPVGANSELISHGENGFLASSASEWFEYLSTLVRDVDLRARLGQRARETIEAGYSAEHASVLIEAALRRACSDPMPPVGVEPTITSIAR